MRSFASDSTIARREVLHGTVWLSMPVTVVNDDGEVLVVRVDPGAPMTFPEHPFGPHPWSRQKEWGDATVLQIHREGDWYAVWRIFDGVQDRGWYVNFEAPLSRGDASFDTEDYGLDMVVQPDGSWIWKDVDDPDLQVEEGRTTPALRQELTRQAEAFAVSLDAGQRWWCAWDSSTRSANRRGSPVRRRPRRFAKPLTKSSRGRSNLSADPFVCLGECVEKGK